MSAIASAQARPQSSRRESDGLDHPYAMLIDGKWTAASAGCTFRCVDPYTEQSWGEVPEAQAPDVDRAVLAARRAFDRDGWPRQPAAERAALLRRLGALIETHADALTHRQIRENGKLVAEMRPGIDGIVRACYYFAGLAETLSGATLPPVQGFSTYTLREPIGVIAAVTPWNSPLAILGWKLFPALAAGNTVVVKPSEVTPTSTLELARLALEAGFPPGVVNVVTGHGPAGAALIEHPGVDKIAFTGSTATGKAVARAAAERCARVSLELGGKSPNILFADANLPAAVDGVIAGIFAASGQTCVAGSRVLIERGIYQEMAGLLVKRARELIIGDPLERATQLGPLASPAQLAKVLSYFEVARTEGLERLTGGRRSDRTGFFVEPTVYGQVRNDSRVAREEIFGPVAALIPFRDEDEALAIANDTPFGLAAGLWTESIRRVHRLLPRLRAGTVWVNNYRQVGYGTPFGGFRQSGIGRELGPEALHEYTEVKSVWIDNRA